MTDKFDQALNEMKTTLISLQNIFASDREKIKTLKRASESAQKVFTVFQKKPVLTVSEIVKAIASAKPTVIKSLNHLIDLGIIVNNSEKKWGQLYTYKKYADILSSDAEPL